LDNGEEFDEIEFVNPIKLTEEELKINAEIEDSKFKGLPIEAQFSRVASKNSAESIKKLLKIKQDFKDMDDFKNFEIEIIDNNIHLWHVKLKNFEGQLKKELDDWAKKFKDNPEVMIELRFSLNFPAQAPSCRIIKPRFVPVTDITSGGVLNLRVLKDGWQPKKNFDYYLRAIRDFFQQPQKLDTHTTVNSYSQEEANASSYRMLRESSRSGQASFEKDRPSTVMGVAMKLYCHSARAARVKMNEYSDKIIVPPSILEKIDYDSLEVQGAPVTFEVTTKRGMRSFCGVIEFTASDGNAILPKRLMNSLMIAEGEFANFRMVNLSLGTYAKFRPWSKDFYTLEDPIGALTDALFHYVTITLGDTIVFECEGKEIFLDVLALKPKNHICLMKGLSEHGLEFKIEFEKALDYEEERDPLEVPLATESEED
jgi:ubiquitin-protein ligase